MKERLSHGYRKEDGTKGEMEGRMGKKDGNGSECWQGEKDDDGSTFFEHASRAGQGWTGVKGRGRMWWVKDLKNDVYNRPIVFMPFLCLFESKHKEDAHY